MKKIGLAIVCLLLLVGGNALAQHTKTIQLDDFTKLNASGNLKIHLEKSDRPSIEIQTKKEGDLQDIRVEVRNGELLLAYENGNDRSKTPEFVVRLAHSDLHHLRTSGLISIFSEDVLNGRGLRIESSGITKGEIEVATTNLGINSEGITNLKVSGKAEDTVLHIQGIGKINAERLKTNSIKEHSDGFAKVKLGS